MKLPVIAAGGIMDGRGVIAALALGAEAAQLGTRFLLARESGATPAYRRRLLESDETDTVVTDAYTAWKRQDADRVFSWAASVYPGLFNGATSSGTIAGYYYRSHAGTGIYLGLQESTDDIYVHDFAAFNYLNVGALRGYLDLAGRAGY